jgi:hypothetical protein|tara:strand:- start:2109 stop:2573 length:465 start_codon:yes stop_codon:yes gene_type:complete
MATDKRSFPNSYFAWYNDDDRLAIVCQSSGGSYCSLSGYDNKSDCETAGGTWVVSGQVTTDKYDTYTGSSVTGGLRIHTHSKYGTVSQITDDLKSDSGLDTSLHPSIIDYIKSRLLEDAGDLQRASYYKVKYEKIIKQYPHRKSGIRALAVPRL